MTKLGRAPAGVRPFLLGVGHKSLARGKAAVVRRYAVVHEHLKLLRAKLVHRKPEQVLHEDVDARRSRYVAVE